MTRSDPLANRHALFPGTFDPVTHGHLDLLRRAALLFDRLTVAVASHPTKAGLLPVQRRLELLREATAGLPGVDVVSFDGLVVEGARAVGATVLVRGVRNSADVDYELQMARTNRALAPEIETLLLGASPEHAHVSSTLVRQIASLGGDVSHFVPAPVVAALRELLPKTR